jgi:hypothetical protein
LLAEAEIVPCVPTVVQLAKCLSLDPSMALITMPLFACISRKIYPASQRTITCCSILAVFLVIKLFLLTMYGPLMQPDTAGYLYIADRAQDGTPVFSEVPDWKTSSVPALAFRTYGYPLVVLLARWVGGGFYTHLLVLIQVALTLYVGKLLFGVSCRITSSLKISSTALAFFLIGQTMLWDQCILSDSLYISLFNIVVLTLATMYYDEKPVSMLRIFVISLIWCYSILIRDSGIYFTIIPIWLLCLLSARSNFYFIGKRSPIAIFALTLSVFIFSYVSWNTYRTGESYFSITGVANFMRPSFDIAKSGKADPFDGTDAVSSIVRAHRHDFSFAEQLDILQRIHDEMGLSSPKQLLSLVEKEYAQTVIRYPVAYARFVLENLDPRILGSLMFDPLDSGNAYFQLGVPPYLRVVPALAPRQLAALIKAGDIRGIVLGFIALVTKAISVIVFLWVLVTVPLRARSELRAGHLTRDMKLALILLASCGVVNLFFALVHSEDRLRMPFVPSALIVSAYCVVGGIRLPIMRRASS